MHWVTHLYCTVGNCFLPDMFASEVEKIYIIKLALHTLQSVNIF